MTDKKSKMNEGKWLPKGLRLHIRLLKQEARKESIIYRAQFIRRVPEKSVES